ncbi:hypothetical protein WR25_26264 isoform A [Diploscapter pachys]|uniref:LTD domain-containing protein n=1 Tax=Diploscapter pachys TaxID=2018661 RepID=A0A2A2JSZ1_9BILA|nr:hypothetical protein WR25_26264 isoform A [Diploscapter pachys]
MTTSEKSDDYRSSITIRPGFTRTQHTTSQTSYSTNGMSSGSRYVRIAEFDGIGSVGALSPLSNSTAAAIRDAREREKKEMSELNDRLASYIEKVRFLEAQNKKLENDLKLLSGKWGNDAASVRVMFETELKSARDLIDDSDKQREGLESEIRRLLDDLANFRKKYEDAVRNRELTRKELDDLLDKLGRVEAEINSLKRRLQLLEDECGTMRKENQRLVGELNRYRNILDHETLQRIDFQNQAQALLEECDFLKRVHESEIHDLLAMAYRDTTIENREYFKTELSSAIRDIRQEYDQVMNVNRTDVESWYKLKVQEIHTQASRNSMEQNYAREEVKRLRTTLSDMRGKLADLEGRNMLLEKQIQDLQFQMEEDMRSYETALNDRDVGINKMKEECKVMIVELQMLIDTKQTLDAEIAIYRNMLEGVENRAGLRQLVEQVVKTTSISQAKEIESMRVLKGETTSHTSYSKSAKGNITIQEVAPDGKYIVLENMARREENIGDWKLRRKVLGKPEKTFIFPNGFILGPQRTVKIYARGQGIHAPPDSLVYDTEDSWGTGTDVQTTLYNREGEERASHSQRASHA